MAAPKGNKYWQLRTKDGRDKEFDSPEELWKRACQYFEWIDNNPLLKNDFKGKDVEEVTYELQRPYTQDGLQIFLDITDKTWGNYSNGKNKSYKDFFRVSKRINKIIKTQKFEGATAGIFNTSIIARDLGLADKKEVTKVKVGKDKMEEVWEDD